MSQFRLEVQYIKGEDNVVADAMSRWAYPASQAGGDVSMHGTLQDREEMDVILSDEKREEKESATVAVALMEGEYERRLIMMEQHFEIESGSRKPVNKARVCMCPGVTVTPSRVVRRPDSYVMCGECIYKRDARIWQPENAGQSLFQCVIGMESEISV